MSIVTRCPACGTAFKVQPAQLSARGGKVRCGRCATVFEGVACMVEPGSAQRAAEAGDMAPEGVTTTNELPAFLAEPAPRRTLSLVWGFVALLALLALAAQVTYRYRTEISSAWPASRAPLAAVCLAIGCEVRLPRRTELLSIESSDLQADPRRENVLRLNALLRNRAAFAQESPSLELTLTDQRDHAVVRRVLRPPDYLGAARAGGLDAGAEVNIVVHFDASRVRATGYRLYLFYP